jgi:hypothetical protein
MRFLNPRHALGAVLALLLFLCVTAAWAAPNQCWDTVRSNWQPCANDLPVLARATAGPYGDWNGGTNRLWQDVPTTWAVYACEADLPVGHGDGCPTPGTYTQERFKLKSELVAAVPPLPPSPPPTPTWTGQATLTWTPPTTRTDGSPLTNLASYNIYAGQAQPLAWLREVPVPASSTVITGLAAGTWLFEITSKDAAGFESEHSGTATVAIAPPVATCTAPQPPAETRTTQCTAPAVGSWTQTRTYAAAAYPACWTAGEWLPATAPTGACVVPERWAVRTNGTQTTRPAYELIRNAADTAWALGYKLGDVAVGKPCTGERAIAGATEYRRVAEADVALLSPTYRGRTLVAVCAKQ